MGLDEIRRFNAIQNARIPCFADARTASDLRRTFRYIFEAATPKGGGLPQIELFTLAGEFCLGRTAITPVPLWHGQRIVLGYRFGPFAYLTDCSAVPDDSWALLSGVDLLVVDALRHRPHPTHFSVAQALAVVERLRPSGAWFTHIAHDLPHAATCAQLPEGVELAYDGLTLEFAL
jgi:phosphoribosyl 1,2-cyclic phosphate phosphodiesterase